MPSKTLIEESLYRYLLSVSLEEPEVLAELRAETESHPEAIMQIPPEQGQFLALLVNLIGAEKALEIGVFTGYSSLAVALALPPAGKLVACDRSDEFTSVARRYWAKAGVADKIELHLGPALVSLAKLVEEGQEGTFDFAFIDADKPSYEHYYEFCLRLLRPGGLIVIDNVLQAGKVIDADNQEEGVAAMRAFNQRLHRDRRIRLSMLPVADGLTLAMKR